MENLLCVQYKSGEFFLVRVFEEILLIFITMAFIASVDELQALLDACSSTQEWEMLTESILIPDEWIPIAYARLSKLTAGVITWKRETYYNLI